MDKRTTYFKLNEILTPGIITLQELRTKIIINIGGDERTIFKCIRILNEIGKIKDIGNNKFKIL
jgi:hypothetical protein